MCVCVYLYACVCVSMCVSVYICECRDHMSSICSYRIPGFYTFGESFPHIHDFDNCSSIIYLYYLNHCRYSA